MKYFCTECGAELESEEATFCQECGAKVVSEENYNNVNNNVNRGAKRNRTDGNKQSPLFKGVAAVVVLLLLVVLFVPRKVSFSIKDYIKDIEYIGYNGEATLSYDLDVDALENDILKKKKMNDSQEKELHQMLQLLSGDIEVSKKTNLQNDDKITISISEDSAVVENLNYLGIKLKDDIISKKVEGLRDVVTVQLSEDFVSVNVSGYFEKPNFNYVVDEDAFYKSFKKGVNKKVDELDEEDLTYVYNYIVNHLVVKLDDNNAELAKGDEVTCVISAEDKEALREEVGVIFEDAETKTEINNLENMIQVDLAECITADIQGSVPNLHLDVSCDTENPISQIITSWLPESQDFTGNNGDVIEISIFYDSELADKLGYLVTNDYTTVTITGASEYLLNSDDITTDAWKTLLETKQAELEASYFKSSELLSFINEKFSDTGIYLLWNYWDIQPYEVINVYAENQKGSGNIISLVYQIQMSVMRSDETIGTHTFYQTVNLRNLQELEDGSLQTGDGYFDDGCNGIYYDVSGLSTLEEMIESSLNEKYPEGTIHKNVTCNEEIVERNVPERIERVESEVTALLDTMEEINIPDVDKEIEEKASAVFEYDGHKYYRFDMECTWKEAEEFCQQYGYHLASIDNVKELDWLNLLISSEQPMDCYWVGLHYENHEWMWTDGTNTEFNSWYREEPNRDSEEYPYALLYVNSGVLENVSDEKSGVGFIMEVDAASLQNSTYLESRRSTEYKNIIYETEDSFHEKHYVTTVLNSDTEYYSAYDLNGEFRNLTGSIFVSDATSTEANIVFSIFGDGKLLYHQTGLNRQSNDIKFNIDVTGVQNLVLETANMGDGESSIILDYTRLYKAETATNLCDYIDLRELEPIDGNYYEIKQYLMRDNTGYLHDGAIRFNANKNAFVVWNLDYEYTNAEFTCKIPECGNQNTSVVINVYGDNVLLDSSAEMNKASDSYHFSSDIDLSAVRLLKIEVINQGEGQDVYADLVDAKLYYDEK